MKSEDLAIYDFRILWRHVKTSNSSSETEKTANKFYLFIYNFFIIIFVFTVSFVSTCPCCNNRSVAVSLVQPGGGGLLNKVVNGEAPPGVSNPYPLIY